MGSMVVMGLTGSAIAVLRGQETSVAGGILTAYLVVTGLTTVRPPTAGARRLDAGAMLVAVAAGMACLGRGMAALAQGSPQAGVPVPMFFLFAAMALAAAAGDLRVLRAGPPRGAARITRHLWRMCFALWVATGSFFLGQADEFPEPLRVLPLLAVPAFLPLLAMAYWLARVRLRNFFPAASVIYRAEAAAGDPRPPGLAT